MSDSTPTDLERALGQAKIWIETLVEAMDIDPDTTAVKVTSDKRGEIAKISITDTLELLRIETEKLESIQP